MVTLKLYMDTHDKARGSFPADLTPEQFEAFFAQYEEACREESVIPVRLYVGYQDGLAFCLNLAASAEAVRRAHERVGLPFDTITEVGTASPWDTFFGRSAT